MFSQNKAVLFTAIALSTAFTACAGDAAHSGTCAAQIAQLEQQIRGSGPTAPQSIEAQLHHQPTPRTVQNAESKAIADADASVFGRHPAKAYEAPWCAVILEGYWDCQYRSIEECRPNVLAGNRGWCNPSPFFVARLTEDRRFGTNRARAQ